nr:ribonuclease H-like domain-containing protein [Tanacetum cinerariifolium]
MNHLLTYPMITRSQLGIIKPTNRLSLNTFFISLIPKNPSHALQDPHWHNAMYDEYNVLVKNGTWLLVPRLAGVNMVRSMWLFKHKFHVDGTLSHFKARLVANGRSRQLGVDFDEIFSPVVKPATIRMPLGFVESRYPDHVCLLQRSLYGLKQAPRAWFQRFAGYATRAAKRQHTLSRSSAEAACRGVANVVVETAWFRNLLCELHSHLSTVTLVYCDNVSAVYMSANLYADIFNKRLL